jgi:hypothetical protein
MAGRVTDGSRQKDATAGDIDIIGRDHELVLAAAKTVMGGDAELLRKEHSHEYANLWTGLNTPDEQFADIHFRYNITGFRSPLDADRDQPARQPGNWEVRDRFAIRPIIYPEMEEFAVRRRVGDSTVTVLSPELSAIIRCAHMYVDYLINASPLPIATVRLDELATIVDLMSLPDFDPTRFAAACHRFEADLVIAFARELAVSLLGRDPFRGLPVSPAPGTAPRWFPHSLWWDGIDEGLPVNLGWSPADLVVRSPGYPDITELLGPTVLRSDPAGKAWATLLAAGDGGVRCMYRLRPGSSLDVAMTFQVQASALDLKFSLPATPEDRMSAVGISSGDWRYEVFFKPGGNHIEFSDYSIPPRARDAATADCQVVDGRHLIRFVVPWPALGRQGPPAVGAPLPLLVKVRQQDRNWGPVRGIVVAPVTLDADSQSPWT